MFGLKQPHQPKLLVGFDKADDAGVYLLTPEIALIQTVDFFPPIVDDPVWYGRIAAANALSDVYAMGGKPITALNVFCFPEELGVKVMEKILQGGLEKMIEAGCTLAGGHSVKDSELKYRLGGHGRRRRETHFFKRQGGSGANVDAHQETRHRHHHHCGQMAKALQAKW